MLPLLAHALQEATTRVGMVSVGAGAARVVDEQVDQRDHADHGQQHDFQG